MRPLFYSTIVLLIGMQNMAFSQNTQVIKESIEVGNIELLELESTDLPISILPSIDDNIHIDFKFHFKGVSKSIIKEKRAQVKFEKKRVRNILRLNFFSANQIQLAQYVSAKSFTVENFLKEKIPLNKQKTKNEIINEIKTSELESEKFISQIIKQIQEDPDAKIIKAYFVLYVPSQLRLKINAKNSRILLEIQNPNVLELSMDKTSFKAINLSNANVSIKDASFKVENFINGTLNLDKSTGSLIGGIKNTTIDASFSKVEIGEVDKNVTINDFNSELYFYNFSENFKLFKLTAEYTNIHLYMPKDDFSMTAIGHNTVNHYDNMTVRMQPNKTGKKIKMMSKEKSGKEPFAGHFDFDIVHGILHSHNNTFKPNKNN